VALRGRLQDVAAGLLGSFASRNHDIDGYWGLGVLRAAAEQAACTGLQLNLLTGAAEPRHPLVVAAAASYQGALERQLARRNMLAGLVSRAEIQVTFEVDAAALAASKRDRQVARCSVLLVDDRGREYQASAAVCCAPHDPAHERRSTRAGCA
jgi:hypothetical protein